MVGNCSPIWRCAVFYPIFGNNAIKYNVTDGWIEVIAQQTSSTVQVTIINSAQVIPVGDRDHIFERFYRGDPTHTHKIEGIGLGLNLAREIVRAHHGELVLNSTSDGETSFIVSLPIVQTFNQQSFKTQ